MSLIAAIFTATALDLVLGDPPRRTHPVVVMGAIILLLERLLRRHSFSPRELKLAGVLLALLLPIGVYGLVWLLLFFACRFWLPLGLALEIWFIYTALSARDLHKHARGVAEPLEKNDLTRARKNVAMIVGRDTENLDSAGIVRAAVETVAENTVDGIISPLFYAFIGGAPLALAFKAVSTLDSMVGYRNRQYCYFGWASARLDDAMNYLPARLAGILFLLVSPFTPGGVRGVASSILRYAGKHPSPNGGIPESAVAGALRIKLGGWNSYRGRLSHRAEMGPGEIPLQVAHINGALGLMYAVTFLTVISGILIRLILI